MTAGTATDIFFLSLQTMQSMKTDGCGNLEQTWQKAYDGSVE